jgi:hypothetical protein
MQEKARSLHTVFRAGRGFSASQCPGGRSKPARSDPGTAWILLRDPLWSEAPAPGPGGALMRLCRSWPGGTAQAAWRGAVRFGSPEVEQPESVCISTGIPKHDVP